jgi:hypothetical protein
MTKQEAINYINSLTEDVELKVIIQDNGSLKASEVMALLGISRVTLCHYVKKGLITVDSNYTGKQYRYNKDSVMALIR